MVNKPSQFQVNFGVLGLKLMKRLTRYLKLASYFGGINTGSIGLFIPDTLFDRIASFDVSLVHPCEGGMGCGGEFMLPLCNLLEKLPGHSPVGFRCFTGLDSAFVPSFSISSDGLSLMPAMSSLQGCLRRYPISPAS
jgi:hypothetical protein